MIRTGVLFLVALLALAAPAASLHAQQARVTGVRVVPHEDRTELVIEMDGSVATWADFSLAGPPRLVVDIPGARNAIPANRYANVNVGGVRAIRTSQFSGDTVRVVIDLTGPTGYEIGIDQDGIQIDLARANPLGDAALTRDPDPMGPPPAVLISQVQEQPRITVTFQETDIRDVLATFAEFTGRSIVPGSGVEGTVTASIRNQPWDVALQTILNAYGLAAEETPSGIIQVDDVENLESRRQQEPLVTRTFRINYVPVEELQTSLQPLMTPDRGRIAFNASTNTLILTDTRSVVDDVSQMLDQLDIRTPQVSIQAKIIFVNRTDVEELGITYDLKDSRGNSLNRLVSAPDPQTPGSFTSDDLVLLGGNSIAALGNANVRVQGPQLETVISLVLGRYTLISFVDALQSAELSDVQAAPSIRTLDNQEAEIWVGEETPIRVVDAGGAAGGAGGLAAPRATAELVETGIRLRVTPHVTADRRILMQLHAERSSAQLAATDIGVNFQRQLGTTRVMVRDGETVVIAGLTVTEVATTRAGIPFLMDLPVVGWLFRTDRSREQQRDLMIMVTPRIIEDPV
jgi:type IV pilus assembly protein PilQ